MSAPGLIKRPLLPGRLAAFLGIALIALGLRSAVSSFAPMMHEIEQDIPFTEVTYGIFGMLAPLTFAISGAFTPWLSRKLSLEWAAVLAAAFMGVGQLLRGFAGDTASFFLYSIAGMMGIGAANVLLPPLVKRFFPDRIPLVSQLYLVLAVVSSIFPPFFAVPLADATSWRFSIAAWSIIEIIAVVPWLFTLGKERGDTTHLQPVVHVPGLAGKVWRHPTTWALTLGFAVASFNTYVMFAWLPTLLIERAGITPIIAGILLSLYCAVPVLNSFVLPRLVARMNNLGILYGVASAFFLTGYLGLFFFPGAGTWFWVFCAGAGPMLFSITLVGINYRSQTQAGAVVLSGQVQGMGYLLGALGPLAVGFMRSAGLSWDAVLIMCIISVFVAIGAAFGLRRKRYVDAD